MIQTDYDEVEALSKYSHCPGSGFSTSGSQLNEEISSGIDTEADK